MNENEMTLLAPWTYLQAASDFCRISSWQNDHGACPKPKFYSYYL